MQIPAEKQARRELADQQYAEAFTVASLAGLCLTRKSESHYQLRCPTAGWVQNIYPGNRRLFWDRNHTRPPYLQLPHDWTLLDVVKSSIVRGAP